MRNPGYQKLGLSNDWSPRARSEQAKTVSELQIKMSTGANHGLRTIQPVSGKSPSNGYHSHFTNIPETEKWVQIDLGESKPLGSAILISTD